VETKYCVVVKPTHIEGRTYTNSTDVNVLTLSNKVPRKFQGGDDSLLGYGAVGVVAVGRRYRRVYCFHHQGDQAVHASEKSVYFYVTAQCLNLEGCHLHTCRHENLKSHII